jgi:glycosyltransferase involved in cell wall biosynthesis
MTVIINGMAAIEQKTGVGHYIDRVYRELSQTIPATLFPGDGIRPIVNQLAPRSRSLPTIAGNGPTSKITWKSWLGTVVKETARTAAQSYFTAYTAANRCTLYHEPNYIPFRSELPLVITAHDLSVLLHPEWHPAERVRIHETKFLKAVERAEQIITGSEQVRRELLSVIAVSPDRVTAVYYGIGEEFRRLPDSAIQEIRRRLNLPSRFFLYVGAVEPRKNLLVALRAFVDLPPNVRESCPMILAGPWAWKANDVAEYFDAFAKPAGARHLGYVSDDDRVALYNAATALVYPSRYEGFGLPPVEMLACGGMVLAGTALAVREVLGSHGVFLDPDDVIAWRSAMHRVATDHAYVTQMSHGGSDHARQYSWPRCARETLAVYHRVLGVKSSRDRKAA